VKRPEKRDVKKSVAEIRDARARGPRPAAAVANEGRDNGEMVAGEGAAPEELDQVVNILGEMDIEVEAVEETALAEEPDKAEEPEWTEEKWWGRRLAALRVDLGSCDPDVVAELLEDAWRASSQARRRSP